MEQTTQHSRNRTKTTDGHPAGVQFMNGMHAYALAQPEQIRILCCLSAAAVLGILLGIFCFFFFDAAPIADSKTAADDYVAARAYSSYSGMRTYLAFFCPWFFHHAWMTALPLCTVITVYPLLLCHIMTVLRGMLCGFSVCMLTGTFSVFAVYFAFAQTALCAACVYLSTKCIRYASRRRRLPPPAQGHLAPQFSLQWLLGDSAPLAVAALLTLTTQVLGQLLISCVCTLLAG